MTSSLRDYSHRLSLAVGLMAALASGCAVQEQTAPALSGPSELGLSISVMAVPQVLPRDGSSTSTIAISAFDSDGKPKAGQRLLITATAGAVTPSEVLTNGDGNASVIYIAPGLNERVSAAVITAIPVGVAGGDSSNTNARTVRIDVLGPDVPVPDFVFSPTDAAVQELVSFDASTTRLGNSACQSACSYSWDFGDGSSDTGLGTSHSFSNARVYNVTLTVSSLAAGTSASITKPVTIAVPSAPVAELSISPSSPTAGQTIIFSSASVLAPGVEVVRHVWNLDNGAPPIDTGSTPSYTLTGGYAAGTTHQVTLTITDNYGRTSRSEPRSIAIP